MLRNIILITTCIILQLVIANPAFSQSLTERREIDRYQKEKFPELKSQIEAAAQIPVEISVDWNKLAVPGQSENYLQDGFWTKIYFTTLISALKAVTQDELGLSALKEKLKKIVITYDQDTAPASAYASGVSFVDGTLTINFRPWSNIDDEQAKAKAIQSVLEAGL